MSNGAQKIREFRSFRLFVEEKELRSQNERIVLPEKAMEVLIALTELPGEILKKEELAQHIWGDTPGAEKSLTHAVHLLRKTFRDRGHDGLIKTLSRRGYRFVGEVIVHGDSAIVETPRLNVAIASGSAEEYPAVSARNLEIEPLPEASSNAEEYRRSVGALVLVAAMIFLSGLGFWKYGRNVSGTTLANVRSLAVLPLHAAGDEDESLRMRITDSVITRLSEIETIRIRPTAVVKRYLNSTDDPVSAGRELLVDAVLSGSVELKESLLHVELTAISTRSGARLWSDRFVGEPDRLLALQDIISERILALLRSGDARRSDLLLAQNPTDSPEAYENFLMGRYFWQKRTNEGLRRAITHFGRAIEIDPAFAEAYVGMADSHYLIYDYYYDRSEDNIIRAKNLIERAIEIDPDNHQALVTSGLIQTTYEWDWEGAARSFEKALDLHPVYADAFHRRGMLRVRLGDFRAAEADLRRAAELEPTSLGINVNLGVVLYFSGKNEDAIRHFRKVIEKDGTIPGPRWYLARCLWHMGDRERGMREYVEALRVSGSAELAANIQERLKSEPIESVLGHWIEEWNKTGVSEHSRAILLSHKNDTEGALKMLQASVDSRHPWVTSMMVEPEFRFLRESPDFFELVDRLGLRRGGN